MGELVSERGGDARVIGQRIGLDVHVDHHSARIRLAGRGIDERHGHGFIGAKFLNADKQGAHAEPKAQSQKGIGKIPIDFAARIQLCFS